MKPSDHKQLRSLQSVHAWLKTTENWVGRLLENLSTTDVTILSRQWIPGTYHSPKFRYISLPISPLVNPEGHILPRIWNGLMRGMQGLEMQALAAAYRGSFDLLHSHFAFMGWQSMGLAKAMDVPHVVSFYGFDYENLPFLQPIWNRRYQIMFDRVDRFVCEGPHGANVLEKMGCPANKISVCRLGIDKHKIPDLKPRHRNQEVFQLVMVASLTEKKGHVDAIRATAMAARQKEVRLTLVGGERDVQRQDLRDLAKQEGISDRVSFVEELDFSRLHEFLAEFDAFIHPSCYSSTRDCEGGAPIVLLDSQAMGLPVISTTHCDIPDEILDGVSGFLTSEKRPDLLAESILKMAALSDSQYESMRRAGRSHVLDRYDASKNARELDSIYRNVVAR